MPSSNIHQSLYSTLSKSLSSTSTIKQLHKIHSLLITSGLHQTPFFSGKLITKYSHFKHPHSCSLIFTTISPTTNVYQWNTIIRAMTHNGLFTEALDYYYSMRVSNIKPDKFTFPSMINACASCSGKIETAKIVHEHVLEMGFGSDLYIGNALVDMYARFGELGVARKVFDEMPERDVVSWNSLVSGYSANEEWEEALDVFYQSRVVGVRVDSFMVSSVLAACGGLGGFSEGHMVHGLTVKLGVDGETRVCNGLLSMYFKSNNLKECRRVFSETDIKDAITWNTVICGYSQACLYRESINLFMKMLQEHKPDILTITSVLRACGHTGDLKSGRFVHNYMVLNGYECDTKTSNILIDMYSKCGYLPAAREIFNKMKSRDLTSWNALINGIIKASQYEEALATFRAMKMDIKPDFVTYVTILSLCTLAKNLKLAKELHCETIKTGFNACVIVRNALIDVYAKCGNMEDALNQFENMNDRDIVSWNTVISACSHSEEYNLGFKMISRMRLDGILPNMATILCTLPLCSNLGAKRQGKEIHGCVLKSGFESNVPISNALIEMYSKCGNLRNSLLVFEHMKNRDVVTWTALIYAYGMYGHGVKATTAFEDMKATGIVPDQIAYLAVIFACSHSGLVEQGRLYFSQMKNDYNIDPQIEHYACVVDLLARSGRLTEAEKFILSLPKKPDASIWGSLLSACRASGHKEIAERASKHIIKLNSENTGYYILVSNAYASLGKWDQVRTVRKSIKSKGLKKDAGKSWIDIDNKIYAFSSGDKFFEQYEEVKNLLEVLYDLIAKEGYVANLRSVFHDVNEDEKRDILCGHSERLAIAFGLLNTKAGTPLQIMKNLRVCEDCHTVTKYISKIVQREFLVRDANRFHLFKNGSCSCGDYW
ncbi:putative tetratricopeptide-like helical domain superfamily, DYW domain-containing protein [Helianthus annuus]|nr:putative tetratricopeptide-like helical domain superfamily, DYW domain-containing protein [Helianthus annuus]